MSLTPLTTLTGVMPWSSLYAVCRARRRFGLADGALHGRRHLVGVHDDLAVDVARGAADGLDEAGLAAQEALLVGVEDGDQRDLRQVEPLAQQVDADEDVELAQPQVAHDLDALERVDLAVQVAHLEAVLDEVVGEVLGHALGERGDEDALVLVHAAADLVHEVVDLPLGGPHLDLGVDEARGADDLLGDVDAVGQLELRPAWRSRR